MVTGVVCWKRKKKQGDEGKLNDRNSYRNKYQFPRGIGLEDDRRTMGRYGQQGEMALSSL
jgi:hypothetical protein